MVWWTFFSSLEEGEDGSCCWEYRDCQGCLWASVSLTRMSGESLMTTSPCSQHRLPAYYGAACEAQLRVSWRLVEPVFLPCIRGLSSWCQGWEWTRPSETQQPCIHQELSSDSRQTLSIYLYCDPFQKLKACVIYDYFPILIHLTVVTTPSYWVRPRYPTLQVYVTIFCVYFIIFYNYLDR